MSAETIGAVWAGLVIVACVIVIIIDTIWGPRGK